MRRDQGILLDPVATTSELKDAYVRYVTTTLPIRNPSLRDNFRDCLEEQNAFVKGPYLEATPPFKPHDKSYRELVDAGLLAQGFLRIGDPDFPLDRRPYQHQYHAFVKLIEENRNVILATGTGSGKTEAFLVPIINYLFREQERGELCPGVRALLLYPMNALANDQLSRLREMLHNAPEITFGRYTGDTRAGYKDALEAYRNEHAKDPRFRDPLPNELLCRDQMHETPPHILLTNYAMLEYLLLRPQASPLFEHDTWRFIVLDEAHVYDGAKGIEMAMLLRRLKDRVVNSERGRLQCIGTSATLSGQGQDARAEVADFASELFSESFEPSDVIEGERMRMHRPATDSHKALPVSLYQRLAQRVGQGVTTSHDAVNALADICREEGVDEWYLAGACEKAGQPTAPESHDESATLAVDKFLYELLKSDEALSRVQSLLDDKPVRSLEELARQAFPDLPEQEGRAVLVSLVHLAARAKSAASDLPLLPVRYHVFMRALEGGYIRLWPEPRLYLRPRGSELVDGREVPVFEAAVCTNCGALYLVGDPDAVEQNQLRQTPLAGAEYVGYKAKLFLLDPLDGWVGTADNDDEGAIADEQDNAEASDLYKYHLCICCGMLRSDTAEMSGHCPCTDGGHWVSVVEAETAKDDTVRRCLVCGVRTQQRPIVSRLVLGRDAPIAVIATTLYQHLPPQPKRSVAERHARPVRQFIVFADSRQDAAFFAPYLERTYDRILWRRILWQAVSKHSTEAKQWDPERLTRAAIRLAKEHEVLPYGGRDTYIEDEAWRHVLAELLRLDRHNDLEATGLLAFRLRRWDGWAPPEFLASKPWFLTQDEAWTLLEALLSMARAYGPVAFPGGGNILPSDPFFAPRNREMFLVRQGGRRAAGQLSWNPAPGASNGREDYLLKLRGASDEAARSEARATLDRLWDHLTDECADHLLTRRSQSNGIVLWQLRLDAWLLAAPQLGNGQWYQCDKCGKLTQINLRDLCPQYRCNGHLRPCDPDESLRENHYRTIYAASPDRVPLVSLSVKEHTAQLASTEARRVQEQFLAGDLNALSCSTTFELGVDIGELQAVLMRNVPPTTANYLQRAGRAGRRTDSVGFAVTYAQRLMHDMYYYQNPESMISGEIRPPRVRVANEKIILRHMNAVALSAFWRRHPDCFYAKPGERGEECQAFFGTEQDEDNPTTGYHLFLEFLRGKPREVQDALRRIVPNTERSDEGKRLQEYLGVENWGLWVRNLGGDGNGVLDRAAAVYYGDLQELAGYMERLDRSSHNFGARWDRAQKVMATIKGRSLIGFLARMGVLPKYGFPVDVVPLDTTYTNPPQQSVGPHVDPRGLQLERELHLAIAEYAPGCEVVAGGYLWRSAGLKRVPQKSWEKRQFWVCERCGRYYSRLAESKEEPIKCTACEPDFRRGGHGRVYGGTFVKPEFGFVTASDVPGRPGERRPRRVYLTEVYFAGADKATSAGEEELPLEGGCLLRARGYRDATLAVVTRNAFHICDKCGWAVPHGDRRRSHKSPTGGDCPGRLPKQPEYLGYEFGTDICALKFVGLDPAGQDRDSFWYSLLYSLVEGAAEALGIARHDLSGVLYADQYYCPQIILYDDVPGGAGHTWRLVHEDGALRAMLEEAFRRTEGHCGCGPEVSCYGCLRNYDNQRHHDRLRRGMAHEALRQLLGR